MTKAALCPGSFDPVTSGHLDIIERASRLFDQVYVTIFHNASKSPLFSVPERQAMVEASTSHLHNIVVDNYDGLLIDYARQRGISVLIKGLRAVSDFEYEFQMAQMNMRLHEDLETFFMMARPDHSFLSSSIIKDVAKHGGSLQGLVPPAVAEQLYVKYGRGKNG